VQLGGTPPEPQGHPSSGPSLRTQRFDAAQQPPNWIFETTPAPRRWLWEGFWPDQVGGIIASVGGGGKSRLLLQLMIRLAAGLPFGPYECCGPRGVVSVMLEDGLAEFHRRLLWDLHAMFPEGVPDAVRAAVLANIRPYDLQGVLGVDIGDGLIDQVAKIAATTRDPCGLVIFDPASLLMPRGVSLKDESASVMVSANNAVVEMTGAASSMGRLRLGGPQGSLAVGTQPGADERRRGSEKVQLAPRRRLHRGADYEIKLSGANAQAPGLLQGHDGWPSFHSYRGDRLSAAAARA
jgi:hypothetical protein